MTIKNPILKNILSILAVLIFGSILLNLTFIFYALIHSFYNKIIPFKQNEGPMPAFFILRPITLFVILTIISWFVFRSKSTTLCKAIFATVPVAVILVFIGINLYQQPILAYSLGALFSFAILIYLYFAKKSWLYYVSVLFVSIALLIMGILGVDI